MILFSAGIRSACSQTVSHRSHSIVLTPDSAHISSHTRVLICPWPDQEGNKLQQPNSNFCKPLKNNSEGCPSNQVSAAAMTSALDEKWRPFSCFFSRVGLRTYQHPRSSSLLPHPFLAYCKNVTILTLTFRPCSSVFAHITKT